jgi:hypothetical protein
MFSANIVMFDCKVQFNNHWISIDIRRDHIVNKRDYFMFNVATFNCNYCNIIKNVMSALQHILILYILFLCYWPTHFHSCLIGFSNLQLNYWQIVLNSGKSVCQIELHLSRFSLLKNWISLLTSWIQILTTWLSIMLNWFGNLTNKSPFWQNDLTFWQIYMEMVY